MDADGTRRANAQVMAGIIALESKQARAVREHLLGDGTALARIQAIDAQAVALRARLLPE